MIEALDERELDFAKDFKEPKIYVHPNKLKYVFIVEKGFSDLANLRETYIDFLTSIAKDVENKTFNNIKKFVKENIEISIIDDNSFAFLYHDIRWEISFPKKNTNIMDSVEQEMQENSSSIIEVE